MNRIDWKNLPVLYGKKVVLRPITLDDTKYIVKWRNNPKVQENFIFQDVFTNEMHNAWMKNKVFAGKVIQYIIELADAHMPVGSIYYRDMDYENESAEFGIFIGEDDARGCGIGTDATQAFVEFGQKTLKMHRIFLRVLEKNEQAYHSYLRAGFQKEGVFRDMVKREDGYINVIFMAVVADSDGKR